MSEIRSESEENVVGFDVSMEVSVAVHVHQAVSDVGEEGGAGGEIGSGLWVSGCDRGR